MDDSRRQAGFRVQEFYGRLRGLVRKYQPIEFAEFAGRITDSALNDRRQQAYYPLHFVVQAVEANCTYYDRRIRTVELTQQRFNAIIDFIKDFQDPYIEYVLAIEPDLGNWAIAVGRQQFVYQKYLDHGYAIVRALVLFVQDQPMPRIHHLFQASYGITMLDWIQMCFATFAGTHGMNSPLTNVAQFLDAKIDAIPKAAVVPFLQLASSSPAEIGIRYREMRKSVPPHLHIFLPSVFLERPLIALDKERFISPHPGLLYRFSLEGLYRACQVLDDNVFSQEFGKSFEAYVAKVFGELGSECQIFREAEIKSRSGGRVCDYVVVHKDTIVLVECKGVRYVSTLATERAIQGDNSTTKLADSLEQISATALRIRQGEFDHLFDSIGKKLIGVSVTFGHIFFSNSPNYIRRFIVPKADLAVQEQWPAPLDYDSQVIPIDTFENIIAVLKSTSLSLSALLDKKLAKEGNAVGDWDMYIDSEYQNQDINCNTFAKIEKERFLR